MNILDVPMRANDADAATVGEYLSELLVALWMQVDGFSGKRPFGNSSWQHDVYYALADAGIMEGIREVYDEGGPHEYVDYSFDGDEYPRIDRLIIKAIREQLSTRSDNAN